MDSFVTFRCTDRLSALIVREADALGLTKSQYIRAVLWRSVGSVEVRNYLSGVHMVQSNDDWMVSGYEDEQAY